MENIFLFLEVCRKRLTWVGSWKEGKLSSASVEIVGWALLHPQERLFRPTPSWDVLYLQQPEFWWDAHTFCPQEQGLSFQESPAQKKCSMLLSFSISTHVNTCWNSVYFFKKSPLFWVPAFVNLFLTWSHERHSAGGWTNPFSSSSLPRAAQGKLVSATSSAPGHFNQRGHVSPQ